MAEQCARKSKGDSESRCSTNCNDIEPIGESRADVDMGNDEDEVPLEAEIPRVRMKSKESHEQRETRT